MSTWERAHETLAPKPFRGDLIAAGGAALAVGLVLLDLRVQGDWVTGVRLVIVALGAALLLGMAWLAPVEGDAPRMYVSALLVAGFPLLVLALGELADLLGGSLDSDGTVLWVGLLVGAESTVFAWRRNSAICTLLAAASFVVVLMAAWSFAFDPAAPTAYEWLCLVSIVVLAFGAIVLRDRHRAHAVSLVDVAGLAALLLATIISVDTVATAFGGEGVANPSAPWGWKLVLAAVGFGLVAYGAVDRERGPVWLGVAVLGAFVALAAAGNLLWWPLILLLAGGAAIAAGLRPTTAAPPPPDLDAPEAPTRPFDPPPDPFL